MRMIQIPGKCSGWAGQAGDTSLGARGKGAALEMRGQESPGALSGLGSIRGGDLGQDRGMVKGDKPGWRVGLCTGTR